MGILVSAEDRPDHIAGDLARKVMDLQRKERDMCMEQLDRDREFWAGVEGLRSEKSVAWRKLLDLLKDVEQVDGTAARSMFQCCQTTLSEEGDLLLACEERLSKAQHEIQLAREAYSQRRTDLEQLAERTTKGISDVGGSCQE